MKLSNREMLYLGLGYLYFWVLGGALQSNRDVTKSYLTGVEENTLSQEGKNLTSKSRSLRSLRDDKGAGDKARAIEDSFKPEAGNAYLPITYESTGDTEEPLVAPSDTINDEDKTDDMYELPVGVVARSNYMSQASGKNTPDDSDLVGIPEVDAADINDDMYELSVAPKLAGETTLNDKTTPKIPLFDDVDVANDDMYELPFEPESERKATLNNKISPKSPLFVMSLPNSGNLVADQYFKCAGLNPNDDYARYWAKSEDEVIPATKYRTTIGACMSKNLKAGKRILQGCGNGIRVWSEIDNLSKPTALSPNRDCFFPNLQLEVVGALVHDYPNATFLNIQKDPYEWYATLDSTTKKRWSEWCNDQAHPDLHFPNADAPAQEWINFYQDYQDFMRHVMKEKQRWHPSLNYIEVKLDERHPDETAAMLQGALGIPETCWTNASTKTAKDIALPIFVASLPESATETTHDYLTCGLGMYDGAHDWTKYEDSRLSVKIGQCMRENLKRGQPILKNCGDYRHWSGIGDPGEPGVRPCFYPSMKEEALQAMYESNPYGTIMNVIRDAQAWVRSIQNSQWTKYCYNSGLPAFGSTEEDWVRFYHWHNQNLREFAQEHSTMTYVEIHLDDSNQTSTVLEEHFGFPEQCWGPGTSPDDTMVTRREK